MVRIMRMELVAMCVLGCWVSAGALSTTTGNDDGDEVPQHMVSRPRKFERFEPSRQRLKARKGGKKKRAKGLKKMRDVALPQIMDAQGEFADFFANEEDLNKDESDLDFEAKIADLVGMERSWRNR